MARLGGSRPLDEVHLDRRVRGRRSVDARGLGGLLLRVTPSFAIAFAAGLLSFLSPCTLPLIPSYVGFLTGLSADQLEVRRGTALLHALAFVAGFSGVFIALGASASALGALLLHWQVWIGRIGGVLVILFGLYLLRVVQPAFLTRERRLQLAHQAIRQVRTA